DDRVERRIGVPLLVDVFNDRFDDEVAGPEIFELRRPGQIAEGAFLVLRRDFAAFDAAGEELVDSPEPFLDQRVFDLADDGFVAGGGADLRDPSAHEAAAENAYCFDLHVSVSFLTLHWGPTPSACQRSPLARAVIFDALSAESPSGS